MINFIAMCLLGIVLLFIVAVLIWLAVDMSRVIKELKTK